jgi:hypothetical protein
VEVDMFESEFSKSLNEIFEVIDDIDILVSIADNTSSDLVIDKLRKIASENCDHSVGVCFCPILAVIEMREFNGEV